MYRESRSVAASGGERRNVGERRASVLSSSGLAGFALAAVDAGAAGLRLGIRGEPVPREYYAKRK